MTTTISTLQELEGVDEGTRVSVATPPGVHPTTPRVWTMRGGRLHLDGAALSPVHFQSAINEGLVTAEAGPVHEFHIGDHVRLARQYEIEGRHEVNWNRIATVGHTGVVETEVSRDGTFDVRWDHSETRQRVSRIDASCMEPYDPTAPAPPPLQVGDRVRIPGNYWVEDVANDPTRYNHLAPEGSVGEITDLDTYRGLPCAMVRWDHGGHTRINLDCLRHDTVPTPAPSEDTETVADERWQALNVALSAALANFDDDDDRQRIAAVMQEHGLTIPARSVDLRIEISGTIEASAYDLDTTAVRAAAGIPEGIDYVSAEGDFTVSFTHEFVRTEDYTGIEGDPCEDEDWINDDWVRPLLTEMGLGSVSFEITQRRCNHD